MKADNYLLDTEIEQAWGNADFGDRFSKREYLNNGLLKCASGYATGHTMKCILEELGLVTKAWTLTKRGKEYLYYAFAGEMSV